MFALIDLSIMDRTDEASWYKSIYTWLLLQIGEASLLVNNELTPPVNSYTWLIFLEKIAEIAEKVNVRLVLILDEVGMTPPAWSTGFFSAIRSIYNHRSNLPHLSHLNFIVSGTFNPKTLIKDPDISDFNIAYRVVLPDFTTKEVLMLASRLGLSAKKTALIADHIYYWTSGQPNLTQALCKEIANQKIHTRSLDIQTTVNHAVQQFLRTDQQHLAHIRKLLQLESTFTQDYVKRIWHGSHPVPAFVPAHNHIQAQLALIGIIKEGPDGKSCIIRNRLYEYILQDIWPDSSPTEGYQNSIYQKSGRPIKIFFSYAHKDKALLKKLKDHLSVLEREGLVNSWYDREISAGGKRELEIAEHLNTAHLILLLISDSFVASDYCYGIEMKRALERRIDGEANVIPILLRPVDWQNTPFSDLKVLPEDGKAVTTWRNRDEAFSQIVAGIRKIIEELNRNS